MFGGRDQDALVYKQHYLYNLYKWYMNKKLIFIVSFLLQITKSSVVNEFQIMEPKYLKDSLPLRTEFAEGITSLWYFLFLQGIILNFSQNYHEEPCKFQLRVSEIFDGEYRKIFPYQVIDQNRCHHINNSKSFLPCSLLVLLLVRHFVNLASVNMRKT